MDFYRNGTIFYKTTELNGFILTSFLLVVHNSYEAKYENLVSNFW
jgi:hypothetical protein